MNAAKIFKSRFVIIGIAFFVQSQIICMDNHSEICTVTDQDFNFSWINPEDGNGKMVGGMRLLYLSDAVEKNFFKNLINEKNVGLIISLTEVPLNPTLAGAERLLSKRFSFDPENKYYEYVFKDNGKKFKALHFPVRDFCTPSLMQVKMILKYINMANQAGENVVIHCMCGIGRTGVMLSIWYAASHKVSGAEAINKIRSLRHESVDTENQEAFVLDNADEFKTYFQSLR